MNPTRWGEEWDALEAELRTKTPWRPEYVRAALDKAWAYGRSVEWARSVLLPLFEAKHGLPKLREALDVSPLEAFRYAQQLGRDDMKPERQKAGRDWGKHERKPAYSQGA